MVQSPPPPMRVRLHLVAEPQAVRDALCRLMADKPLAQLTEDLRSSAEIVLAEVLNNIVEHAYAQSAGPIDVTLDYEHPTLAFEVVDEGLPMPAGRLPSGDVVAVDGLPEGGFGWFLIRSLTRGLVYHRLRNRNRLAFWMDAG